MTALKVVCPITALLLLHTLPAWQCTPLAFLALMHNVHMSVLPSEHCGGA